MDAIWLSLFSIIIHIISIHYTTIFLSFLTKKVSSSRLRCLFRPYKDLTSLHVFCSCSCPLTTKCYGWAWKHSIWSLHLRKQSSHSFDELSIHSMLPWQIDCGWWPILLLEQRSPHNQCLFSVQILFPRALLCACQVNYLICTCSWRPTCSQLVWF